jgi:transposase
LPIGSCPAGHEAYRQAIKAALPQARIVADHFHLVRGANTALDSVRRERQRLARTGKRPEGARRAGNVTWRQDLFHARHWLLKARERLSERQRRQLCELIACEPLIAVQPLLRKPLRRDSEPGTR